MSKRASGLTLSDAISHAQRHGYALKDVPVGVSGVAPLKSQSPELPAGPKMTVPEREYDLILKAELSRREILDYRYQGISLAWGRNPKTGKLMRYKCDFWVWLKATLDLKVLPIKIIEVKGPRIWPKDLIRFRGCRAEWPMLSFELHQRDKEGGWQRIE